MPKRTTSNSPRKESVPKQATRDTGAELADAPSERVSESPESDTRDPDQARSRRRRRSAAEPKDDKPKFPLWKHPSGRWCRKLNQGGKPKAHYFGKVEGDPKGEKANARMAREWPYIVAGLPIPTAETGEWLSLKELSNRFLDDREARLDAGQLSPRTYRDYERDCNLLLDTFGGERRVDGFHPDDFARLWATLSRKMGPVTLGNQVQRIRTIFKFADENALIDRPIRFGSTFRRPSKDVLRKNRAEGGKRLFTAEELRAMLDGKTVAGKRRGPERIEGASLQLRAMILLGINAGMGNHDCGRLPMQAIDLDGGWLTFARPKTGVERRAKLWPETVAAIRAALAKRPQPKRKGDEDCVFITKYGQAWSSGGSSYAVTQETRKLLKRLGINGRRALGFYSLRHTFRTVADATRDFPAVRLVMGHADASIDGVYREEIGDDRLASVADHVRAWLFGAESCGESPKG